MLAYNRTIMCTNIYVLLNIGPGARERRKKEVESSSLSNTFDDDGSGLHVGQAIPPTECVMKI